MRQRGLQLVAAVAAQRAERVAGQALRVDAHRHILGVEHIPVHDGDVLLAVLVVVKGDDVKLPEAAGQFGDRRDLDADLVRADAFTLVAGVLVQQVLDLHMGQIPWKSPFFVPNLSVFIP